MSFVIELVRDVDAPADVVWGAIVDVDAYPQWNPFVVACRTTWKVGDPIVMQVRLLPWFTQSQREGIFEHEPGNTICYGLDGGAVSSRRSHHVEAMGAGRTRYRSHFEMSGFLAPLVKALLGARLEQGFTAMTDALVRRSEELARRGDSVGA
jgi:hypothetical protein